MYEQINKNSVESSNQLNGNEYIKIHNPEITCAELKRAICDEFGIKDAVICGASCDDESLCLLMTVKKAASYIRSVIEKGNQKIAISWGRTVQSVISEFSSINTPDNIVFPLFGATDQEQAYFLSNELARSFADKMGARVKYAWFPYMAESIEDCNLLKKLSYFKKMQDYEKI